MSMWLVEQMDKAAAEVASWSEWKQDKMRGMARSHFIVKCPKCGKPRLLDRACGHCGDTPKLT
jgi:ribosomal protein L32